MLEFLKVDGRIEAVCEYATVNESNKLDNDGELLIVLHVEKNPGVMGCFKYFIRTLAEKKPAVRRVTFIREFKYPGRKPRVYRREQLED